MRRCLVRGVPALLLRRCPQRPASCLPRTRIANINPTTTSPIAGRCQQFHSHRQGGLSNKHNFESFTGVDQLAKGPGGWSALLEQALPPHLRQEGSHSPTSASSERLSARQTAGILLAAQYPRDPSEPGVDLLYDLGQNQDRWRAVVWLVKELAEEFPVRHGRSPRLAKLAQQWPSDESLATISTKPINFDPVADRLPKSRIEHRTLDDLADGQAEGTSLSEQLEHAALGQVWRSLGLMTQACAGGEIRPEVLEIIAYLHHKEIMPQSIYHYEPNLNSLAIQSPPLLSLLSSRILTSLSDAAWRAHEKLIVEEATAQGGEYAALRPEVPGSVYRVRVAGLRPELWMELILWACLRGGWSFEGNEILQAICADKNPWRPVSWRDHQLKIAESKEGASLLDWQTWEYQFKTRAPNTMDAPEAAEFLVERVISAEVVSAYADALASDMAMGVGLRGVSIRSIIDDLHKLQQFLDLSKLGLSTGSWDALILRIFDHYTMIQEEDLQLDGQIIMDLVALSPGIYRRLPFNTKSHGLPGYVLDGNAAMQGMLHKALRIQITTGHFDAAFTVFEALLSRADDDKRNAIMSFMRRRRSLLDSAARKGMFTNNFTGIDYPALDAHIPPMLMGSLLDLAVDAGAFGFVDWLVNSKDIDGPLIPPHLYHNPSIEPGLLRFAAETGDRDLLAQFTQKELRRDSARAFLASQIVAGKWHAVTQILDYLASTQPTSWSAADLALLARTIFFLQADLRQGSSTAKADLAVACDLFASLVRGEREGTRPRRRTSREQVTSVLTLLSACDASWAHLCLRTSTWQPPKTHHLALSPATFNLLLEGVVERHGAAAGRRLLGKFWSHAVRDVPGESSAFRAHRKFRLPAKVPGAMQSVERQRVTVRFPPAEGSDGEGKMEMEMEMEVYGAVVPNTRSVLIILERALDEWERRGVDLSASSSSSGEAGIGMDPNAAGPLLADSEVEETAPTTPTTTTSKSPDLTTPASIIAWSVRRLSELPGVAASTIDILDGLLAKRDLAAVRRELLKVVRQEGLRAKWRARSEEDDDDHEAGGSLAGRGVVE